MKKLNFDSSNVSLHFFVSKVSSKAISFEITDRIRYLTREQTTVIIFCGLNWPLKDNIADHQVMPVELTDTCNTDKDTDRLYLGWVGNVDFVHEDE